MCNSPVKSFWRKKSDKCDDCQSDNSATCAVSESERVSHIDLVVTLVRRPEMCQLAQDVAHVAKSFAAGSLRRYQDMAQTPPSSPVNIMMPSEFAAPQRLPPRPSA